ncbi:MAG: DUF3050 domain-containing protein [Gammaproteobacteria bacterium]|nr:MAG: DUF3050 domain-containing protein [Gammaproteobacteria bacterium]
MTKEPLHNNIDSPRYKSLLKQLNNHPLYDFLNNENNLKIFMEHHVFAVWDFMSLIKALQLHLAPITIPWIPIKYPHHANFINQLVLEEESDLALTEAAEFSHASHFQGYLNAMTDIGANTLPISHFINLVETKGLESALQTRHIPYPAKQFLTFTFKLIERNQPHLLATVIAFGRETIVPQLFQSIQNGLQINRNDAPNLHAYLARHVQLDKHEHGPLAVRMANELCGNAIDKQSEAVEIAEQALASRLEFWNGIHLSLVA